MHSIGGEAMSFGAEWLKRAGGVVIFWKPASQTVCIGCRWIG